MNSEELRVLSSFFATCPLQVVTFDRPWYIYPVYDGEIKVEEELIPDEEVAEAEYVYFEDGWEEDELERLINKMKEYPYASSSRPDGNTWRVEYETCYYAGGPAEIEHSFHFKTKLPDSVAVILHRLAK